MTQSTIDTTQSATEPRPGTITQQPDSAFGRRRSARLMVAIVAGVLLLSGCSSVDEPKPIAGSACERFPSEWAWRVLPNAGFYDESPGFCGYLDRTSGAMVAASIFEFAGTGPEFIDFARADDKYGVFKDCGPAAEVLPQPDGQTVALLDCSLIKHAVTLRGGRAFMITASTVSGDQVADLALDLSYR